MLIQHGAHSHYQPNSEQFKWLVSEMQPHLGSHIAHPGVVTLLLHLRLAADSTLPWQLLSVDGAVLDTLLGDLQEGWRPSAELSNANLLHHAARLGKREMALSLLEVVAAAIAALHADATKELERQSDREANNSETERHRE